MATEAAGIPAPICETRTEESAKIDEQATIFPLNKLPKEEKNQPDQLMTDQLHELPEEKFEDDRISETALVTKISSEANHVFPSELAENPGQRVTNDTEAVFLESNQIDDQPLEKNPTLTKDTSSEKLIHDENTSSESIVDATTCNKNELHGAESVFLQENILHNDNTSLTKPECSEKVLENTVDDSRVEVPVQSKTLDEVAETHIDLTTTEKPGENLPNQVEDLQIKDEKCLEKENDDTSPYEVITIPDKLVFEEEATLLKEPTGKLEELLHAAVEDIKPSDLGQDAETKNALKNKGFTAEPNEIMDKETEETVHEVKQTEERPAVQNVQTPISDEEIEDSSVIKVEDPGEKYEECLENESTNSFANKTRMKGENDEKEAAIHEPTFAKEDQLKSDFSETQNNTLLSVRTQIEKPIQSLQDGSEEIRAAVSSQNMLETNSLVQNLSTSPREIPDDETEEENENISNTGGMSFIQSGGSEMKVEEHFEESEIPPCSETCNNAAIENEELIRSEMLEKEEQKRSDLMMEETKREMPVESLHVACDDINPSTLSQDDGTKNPFNFPEKENSPPEENHVKEILENVEVDPTTTAELSKENSPTSLQKMEEKESSENAKEETISFLKSELSDEMNSNEVAADEVNPEASKQNKDITEHKIEEVSYDKSLVLPGARESETGVAENMLSTPLIETSTNEVSLKEVRLDDKTNYAEYLDIPEEKLSHTEEHSADSLTGAIPDKDELQDFVENTTTERQEEVGSQITLEDNYESHSNPTASEKSGKNLPIQVGDYLEKENQKPTLMEATEDYTKNDASTVTENVKYEKEVALRKEEVVNPEELMRAAFNDDKGEETEANCFSEEGSDTAKAGELLKGITEERLADAVASEEETFENISKVVSSEETGENSKTEVDDSLQKHEESFEKESTESSTSKAPLKDDSIHEIKVENEENMMLKVETQPEKLAQPLKDAPEDIETAVSSQDMGKTIYLEQNVGAEPRENLADQTEKKTSDAEKGEYLENIAKMEENSVIQINATKMELEEHIDNTEKPSLTETWSKDAIWEDKNNQERIILTEEAEENRPVESLHVAAHKKTQAFPSSSYTEDKGMESLQAPSPVALIPNENTEKNSPIQYLEQDREKTSLENTNLLDAMHEAKTADGEQKKGLFCGEENAESPAQMKQVEMEVPTEHLQQATESIEPSNLNQDRDMTCFLAEETHHVNQNELPDEKTEERTANAVDRNKEHVEDVPKTASSEQTGGSLLISDTESIVSHEPKIEECLEKENYNLSLNEATRDHIGNDASAVTDYVQHRAEMVKPDESLHAVADDDRPSALNEDTETKSIFEHGSTTEEPSVKLSSEIGERAVDVVVKDETSEVQNISKVDSYEETEERSKTKADDSQVKHEKCFEKESTESYTSKAIVKDDSIEELKVENEDHSLPSIEAQQEKHVEPIQDAFEGIGTSVSRQEQKLPVDPLENQDDQIENQKVTMDVDKCNTLKHNIASSEEISATRSDGSELELVEQFNDSKKPSVTETSDKDASADEGLRRSILLMSEESNESTSLTEKAQEEKLVESLHVAHEDRQAFASSPRIDEKEIESLESQSAATFVLDEVTDETSSMQHLTKDGAKPSLKNADLPEHIRESEIMGGDLQKEELICSAKNDESTLLKKEVYTEEPSENLQQAQEVAEPSNSNQDIDATSYTAEENLDLNRQELSGERTDDAIDKKEEAIEDVPEATSNEQTGGNLFSSDTQLIVSNGAKVEVPMGTRSEQTGGNSLICGAESIVSEGNVESKYDLCENPLLDVEPETEKHVHTAAKNIDPEDTETPVSSQITDGTYLVDEQPLKADPIKMLDHKLEATEIKETSEVALFSLSQESQIAISETEDMFAKSVNIASEDNKSSSHETEVSEKENLVETLSVTPEDEALSQDTLVEKDEGIEEKPILTTQVAPEHDIALCQDMGKIEVEKPIASLHTAPKDDEALCQDKEVINQKTEGDYSKCTSAAPWDDKPLSQDMEAATKEVDEENHAESLYVYLEKHNESNKDNMPADEDAAEQLIESSQIASTNDSDYTPAKEDDDNIVISHPVPKHQSEEMKEDNVVFQPKEKEEHETDKKDSGTDMPVKDDLYNDTPHSFDTEVTAHKSVDSVQETTEMDGQAAVNEITSEPKEITTEEIGTDFFPREAALLEDQTTTERELHIGKLESLQNEEPAKEGEDNIVTLHQVPEHQSEEMKEGDVEKEEHVTGKKDSSPDMPVKDDLYNDTPHSFDTEVTAHKSVDSVQETTEMDGQAAVNEITSETKEITTEEIGTDFFPREAALLEDQTTTERELHIGKLESLQNEEPAKEGEDNIVTLHQVPEHQSEEMKEDDVGFQPKAQEEPETAKKDSGADMPVIDGQYNDRPHSTDTEVTAHKSVDPVQEENIYHQSEELDFTSTQITQEDCGEVSNITENSTTEVREMMSCEDKKKIIELDTEEKGKNVQYITNPETERPDATDEVAASFFQDSECKEKELSSTELSDIGHEEKGKDVQYITNPETERPDATDEVAASFFQDSECKEKELSSTELSDIGHEEKGKYVQYITNPETERPDATDEVAVSFFQDSECNEKGLSSTELSEEAQVSHEKSLDVTSLVSEEEKSYHNNVGETGCKESTEFKKFEGLEEESTTISTKENVEMCGASMEASEATREMPKYEICQSADLLPRESALLEDQTTTERELHMGKTESLQNEETETEKENEEEEQKKLLECSTCTPIMLEAKDKDLLKLSDEKSGFPEIYSNEIVKDEDDAIKVTASDISSKEILVPAKLEEILDSESQEQNCNVISEAEEAELAEKNVEAAPAEIKPDVVLEEAPKAAIYEATETVAELSREKIHEEDQDTENKHIESCEDETLQGSCQENEANQGEDEFEFVINRYEDKVKNSNIEFFENRDNTATADSIDSLIVNTAGQELKEKTKEDKATADSIDSLVVNTAGQELKQKSNEDTVLDAKPSDMTKKTIDDCEIDGVYTDTTTMMQQDDYDIKHEIPEGSLGKESEKLDRNGENCTSDKVDFNDENTKMLEAEKSEEKADTLASLTENDSKRTCNEVANSETPGHKQVEPDVNYTENVTPDGSICDRQSLISESKDSKETSSLTKTETVEPSKREQEKSSCGNEEQISNDTAEEIKTSEPVEIRAPSLSDLIQKVPAKEPSAYGEEVKPEKRHKPDHEKTKSDEEKDDEEECGEHHKSDSSSEAPVMVEAGDADVKATHKKSHNLLSGVGSKVKHSIAKVKKAITGKSSNPKPTSPK